MNTLNRTAQLILLVLIFIYLTGFFVVLPVPHWVSYLEGSLIMYAMCSVVLNKMKLEANELQTNIPMGEKAKDQWGK